MRSRASAWLAKPHGEIAPFEVDLENSPRSVRSHGGRRDLIVVGAVSPWSAGSHRDRFDLTVDGAISPWMGRIHCEIEPFRLDLEISP